MLQRIRTLAVQAERYQQKIVRPSKKKLTPSQNEDHCIAQKTTFAGAQVLDGGVGVTNGLMRPVAGQGQNPMRYEYFFQVGANARIVSLQCGAFTMNGIASQADIANNLPQLTKADKIGNELFASWPFQSQIMVLGTGL